MVSIVRFLPSRESQYILLSGAFVREAGVSEYVADPRYSVKGVSVHPIEPNYFLTASKSGLVHMELLFLMSLRHSRK